MKLNRRKFIRSAAIASGLIFVPDKSIALPMPWQNAIPSSFTPYTTGLAVWLKMADGSGSTASDSSGNGNNAALTNTPTWTTGPALSPVSGGALSFASASSQYGLIPYSSTFNTAAFTIVCWFNAANANQMGTIAARYYGSCWEFGAGSGGGAEKSMEIYIPGPGWSLGNGTISTGSWVSAAVTSNGSGTITFYVGGVSQGTFSGTPGTDTTLKMSIAARLNNSNAAASPYLTATLSDFRYYTAALSSTILSNIAAGTA